MEDLKEPSLSWGLAYLSLITGLFSTKQHHAERGIIKSKLSLPAA